MPTAGGARWRLTAVLVAVLLLASSCTLGEAAAPRGEKPGEERRDHRVGPVSCKRLGHAEVLGSRPAYAKGPLASYPNSRTVCGGIWLEGTERRFAPQGLALDGQTAWVSGWQQTTSDGFKECRILKVDLGTGRTLAEQQGVQGRVGTRDTAYCRHGGAISLTDEGLWLVSTDRLWLLDPALVGTGADPVLRVWRILHPPRGSVMVAGDERVGIGVFFSERRGRMAWFDIDSLLTPGVLDLVAPGASTGVWELPAADARPVPARLQGASLGPDGELWLASSSTTCGVLRDPLGGRIGFVPGAEGFEFDGDGNVWAVSESGTWIYHSLGRPLVPQLVKLDANALVRHGLRSRCDP